LSRVIRIESASRTRERILQGIGAALRYGASAEATADNQRDILAFLSLSLDELCRSVDETAQAWEKRGYWLKADRFRLDWRWAERVGGSMRAALELPDLDQARQCGIELASHLRNVRVPASWAQLRPWAGAWVKRNGSA
jgi:hypothetical protein